MKIIQNIFTFYVEGFREMSITSKKLWIIILIKLAIMFLILKLFFFENFLKTNFPNDKERSEYVLKQLTKTK